jgi:hypothetical protein
MTPANMKKIIPYLLAALLGLPGCYFFEHIDQLSELGEYSREKDNQRRMIQSINDHYDALTMAIAKGRIGDYKNKAAFEHSFGEPIHKKDFKDGTQRWLYRYAILKTAKDKVFVYFDRDGKQVRWEKVPCSSLY